MNRHQSFPSAMRVLTSWIAMLSTAIVLLSPVTVFGQQQQTGLCARTKMEILQELSLERVGFEATLELTNNDGEEPITDFSAELVFENKKLSGPGEVNDAAPFFFVRLPDLENINSIDGTGVIGPSKRAVIRWFIIPKITAGGTNQHGVTYHVSAKLSGKMRGVSIPSEALMVIPDTIQVKPEAQLDITYFLPRDVQGDDPFTETVESPVPFTVGVIVRNSGHGYARRVMIDSQQPKIIEARRSLLIIARLLGARVSDVLTAQPDLLVNLGDIPPGQARKGAWDMITSLSGEFIGFKASYRHASELGGEETSVIKSMQSHLISHEVLADLPGRDGILDFLADTDRDDSLIPDTLYENEGEVTPVHHFAGATISGDGLNYRVSVRADRAGWGYVRVEDPGQSRLQIERVTRSDGKVLNPQNSWTHYRHEKVTNTKFSYLNIFDSVDLGDYQYTVTFAAPGEDRTPPVTELRFVGSARLLDGIHYVTPETQLFFISEDESPVSIVYNVNGGSFDPAYPFQLTVPGEYQLGYYATDRAGNVEDAKNVTVIVIDEAPSFAGFDIADPVVFAGGEAISIRSTAATLDFELSPNPLRIDATVDVFAGVVAWPSVVGVPSSPSRRTDAELWVEGDHVDYYRYRLNTGNWSAEQGRTVPIRLSNLAAGQHVLSILARSAHGSYGAESNALQVTWIVDPAAPATLITGAPATPTRSRSAMLNVAGEGVTSYRWTIDGGYYRAESTIAAPIELSRLKPAPVNISVIGKTATGFQSTNNATTVSWLIDPMYGSDLETLTKVRTITLTNLASGGHTVVWNGRNDAGQYAAPGWYTVRLVLTDELGRKSFKTELVQIADLVKSEAALADADRGPKHPFARGRWAVWQDQSSGQWNVYAQKLEDAESRPFAVEPGVRAQENAKTDGRYVVWQGRQADGSWDIFVKDLESSTASALSSSSPDLNETNPVIDWPWVVYQAKPVNRPTAPWQLRAHNLMSGQIVDVHPSSQDQLDPALDGSRVVWQDHSDPGAGEIYFKDLETGEVRRLTNDLFGQYHPVISGRWIAWQDNRNGQVDIYGFDLLRNVEIRVTESAENEARPFMEGSWLVCEDDSLGVTSANLKLLHLGTGHSIPLTRSETVKSRPALAARQVIWQDSAGGAVRLAAAALPALQLAFNNYNAVAVTDGMVEAASDVHQLLKSWHAQAGVTEIVRFTSFTPELISETVRIANGKVEGTNFPLESGTFLWVRFHSARVIDLGRQTTSAVALAAGVNVLNYTEFPNQYSSFELLRQMGLGNVRAVRMLDAQSGLWKAAQVRNGELRGDNFQIPNVAVLLLDLVRPVNDWRPE